MLDKERQISIIDFNESSIDLIVESFAKNNWFKPRSIFELYLNEQEKGLRAVLLAYYKDHFAGYVTLTWLSKYIPFQDKGIPEIMDLNVLPPFRRLGIAALLIDEVEKLAFKKSNIVGIGVGLYGGPDGGYGAAQRLYVKKGYIPDGLGVTYDYKPVSPGSLVKLDDDLVLWFKKQAVFMGKPNDLE